MFLSSFHNDQLDVLHDGAVLESLSGRLAFTTDSYVVNPIFFPGGDIGELSIYGTVNDLAMCGARPLYLSSSMIIEEGFSMEELWKVVQSMKRAADRAGIQLVTGDTKVVDKGKGDKIYINTAGIGTIAEGVMIDPRSAKAGDKIMINGPIAAHGIAIMSVREGLEFETTITSDCAPLHDLVDVMLKTSKEIHVLRDPTRGGVASALNEIAQSSSVGIRIDEASVPVSDDVRGACEILGFDPLYVANEGKVISIVPANVAENLLAAMRLHQNGKESMIIGEVVSDHPGTVMMKSRIGGFRVVDMLSGEQLPRIC
jgi:hydrogenase expression/formation protein HypE